jgi:hypothetical protein
MGFRVVQWATGAMGKSCLRAVIDHPHLELVGLYVYGDAKAGKDAGEVARRAPTGVIATRDVDAILALDADVVLHCARLAPPYGTHDSDLIALLASGKNVISINGYSHPAHWGGERLAKLQAACRAGGSSLMAAGLNPGFAAEQIAAVASGVCAELDAIDITESVDCRSVRNPDYVFKILGFGAPVDSIDANDPHWGPAASLNGMYEEVLAALAAHLRLRLLAVETQHRVFPATQALTIAAGAIPAGGMSHVNWRWRAELEGGRALVMSIHWYMETAHLEHAEPALWRIRVDGQPGVRIAIDLDKRPGDTTATSAEQLAVAGAVVNAIPHVCAAPPGVILRPVATPFSGDWLAS